MTDLGATDLLLMRRGLNVKKSGRLRRDLPLLLMLGLLFGDLSSSKGEFRRHSICLRVCVRACPFAGLRTYYVCVRACWTPSKYEQVGLFAGEEHTGF